MANEIAIQHLDDEAGNRAHLIYGPTTAPYNFNVTIVPAPHTDDVLDIMLAVLAPGWEEHEEAYPIPKWDPLSGMIHVGTTIHRNGYVVDIGRAFGAGMIPPGLRRSDIVREVKAVLEAQPPLVPFSF